MKGFRGCTFGAKVYDAGSHHGIEAGRISKLEVKDKRRRDVMHFDRGWDAEPLNGKQRRIVKAILDGFPQPTPARGPSAELPMAETSSSAAAPQKQAAQPSRTLKEMLENPSRQTHRRRPRDTNDRGRGR